MNNQLQATAGQKITEGKAVSKFDAFKNSLTEKKQSIEKVLPAHISYEKFHSVVLTACMQNNDLLGADRPSMMLACVKAASDGLMPDGRDAALVIFNSKIGKDGSGKDVWGKKVQYLPMYAGILKKCRQSNEISYVSANIVYTNDRFSYRPSQENPIDHEVIDGNDRGEFYAAYAVARLKDGSMCYEVMYKKDIEKVRKTSKSGDKNGEPTGIWAAWYEEMAKKTVFRRLSKWLPQSTDKEGNEIRLFDNDDSLDVIDHEPAESYNEDGEIAQTTLQQPDLKEVAKKAKQKKEGTPLIEDKTQETVSAVFPENLKSFIEGVALHEDLYEAVTNDFADDLAAYKISNPTEFNALDIKIKSKLKELESKL